MEEKDKTSADFESTDPTRFGLAADQKIYNTYCTVTEISGKCLVVHAPAMKNVPLLNIAKTSVPDEIINRVKVGSRLRVSCNIHAKSLFDVMIDNVRLVR